MRIGGGPASPPRNTGCAGSPPPPSRETLAAGLRPIEAGRLTAPAPAAAPPAVTQGAVGGKGSLPDPLNRSPAPSEKTGGASFQFQKVFCARIWIQVCLTSENSLPIEKGHPSSLGAGGPTGLSHPIPAPPAQAPCSLPGGWSPSGASGVQM